MQKKTVKAEQPVIDLLVEASPTAAALILKRRKLFRTGGSLFVGQLKRVDGRVWLKASIPASATERNSWDVAHDTASRYRKELGQYPYIEPDRVGGKFDSLSKVDEALGDTESQQRPFGQTDFTNPASVIESLMPKTNFRVPGGMSIPVVPDSVFGGVQGIGGHSLFGFGDSQSGNGDAALGILDPMQQVQDLFKSASVAEIEGDKAAVPALYQIEGWNDLPEARARMFEMEACQLLLEQMPGVPPSAHDVDSLRAIYKSPECSIALRSLLAKLHLVVESELDKREDK